ncbi:hypothetical protein FO519_006246 [Halicephalobus sp. NKZ332]|nr:hypothetical protein FO519_006246 [Halicephalobus sp. NKZ332]
MSSVGSDVSEAEERRSSVHSLRVEPPTTTGTRILQLLVVALFFAGMVGAFCYVVLDRESGTGGSEDDTELHRNASSNWTILWPEYSDSGYCLFIKFPEEGLSENDETEEGDEPGDRIDSYWYQDNDLQQLFTRIDEKYAAYVFPTYIYWATIDPKTKKVISCTRDNTFGYPEFISRLGLYNMVDRHSEIRRITNNKKVFVYDGEPSSAPLHNGGDIGYFIRAYADYDTGVLLGWDTFYGRNSKSKIYHSQCWFDDMKAKAPPEDVWNKLPAECH